MRCNSVPTSSCCCQRARTHTSRTLRERYDVLPDSGVEDIRFMIHPAGDRLPCVHTESSITSSLGVPDIAVRARVQVALVAGTQFWIWNW